MCHQGVIKIMWSFQIIVYLYADGLSGEFIAGIFITSIVVLLAVVLIIGISIYYIQKVDS